MPTPASIVMKTDLDNKTPATGFDVELLINGQKVCAKKIVIEAEAGSSLVKATVTLYTHELDVNLQNVALETHKAEPSTKLANSIPELQAYRKNLIDELRRIEDITNKELSHPDVQEFLRQVR